FMLWPLVDAGPFSQIPQFMQWQLVTYSLLHGTFPHVAVNMLALLMFGAAPEFTLGYLHYLAHYYASLAGAGRCQFAVAFWAAPAGGLPYPTVGASGGVFGLLLAYGMLFPHHRVMLLFPPIPMTARTLVIVYGAIELLLGFTGWQPGVAHFAHLGGMLFGWLLIRHWRGQPPFGRRGPRRL